MRTIVHVQPDGSVILEGLASNRPIPKLPANSFLVNSKDVPGKQDYLVWDSDTSKLRVDPQKKSVYDNRDRRLSLERLVDILISDGVIPANRKNEIIK